MQRGTSNRLKRAGTAVVVLLAHAVVVWSILLMRAPHFESETTPVFATIIDSPLPRTLSFGRVPITAKTENVLHLERLAPKTPDIAVDDPQPPPTVTEAVPLQTSAPIAQQANAGLNGDALKSSGISGGGTGLTLLRRVIPKYPASSKRTHEEGSTNVLIRVDESGRVSEVKVARSSGYGALDDAALEATRRWKFAPLPTGSAPHGKWAQTELRFVYYQFNYTLIDDNAADGLHGEEQVKAGEGEVAVPGTQEALTRFIAAVSEGAFTGNPDAAVRAEVVKMRAALEEWGKVQSIQFTGTTGASRWMSYPIRVRVGRLQPTVDVTWSMFEVHHEHATSEWLIAVDRDGTVWNARASPSPWM